jgi:hypothetical protein
MAEGYTGWYVRCDEPGCTEVSGNPDGRWGAEAEGWTFRRRLDGHRATRGGKDYCPAHRREVVAYPRCAVCGQVKRDHYWTRQHPTHFVWISPDARKVATDA